MVGKGWLAKHWSSLNKLMRQQCVHHFCILSNRFETNYKPKQPPPQQNKIHNFGKQKSKGWTNLAFTSLSASATSCPPLEGTSAALRPAALPRSWPCLETIRKPMKQWTKQKKIKSHQTKTILDLDHLKIGSIKQNMIQALDAWKQSPIFESELETIQQTMTPIWKSYERSLLAIFFWFTHRSWIPLLACTNGQQFISHHHTRTSSLGRLKSTSKKVSTLCTGILWLLKMDEFVEFILGKLHILKDGTHHVHPSTPKSWATGLHKTNARLGSKPTGPALLPRPGRWPISSWSR